MATSITTAIELTNIASTGPGSTWAPRNVTTNKQQPPIIDDVLEASHVADSTAPDGGYGWVVILSGFILLWWSLGTTYAWGVMQTALVAQGLSNPAVLSFVGSLQAALISALAIVNSRFMRKVISTVPSQYFSAKRGLANGFMFAGSGFGGAAVSFILDALIQKLGTAWAYRIIGLMTLATGVPAAWMIKERAPIARRSAIEWYALDLLASHRCNRRAENIYCRRLFKSLVFNLVFLGSAIGTFPLFVPPFFIPLYAKSLGFSSNVGAGLVAGFSLSSAAGRILSGLASDRIGSLNAVFVSLVFTTITMLAIWPTSTTLGPLIVFVVINGAANGAFFSTMPTAISKVFGSARVAVAMSMVVTGWIGGYLMGAPIAGYLLENFGGVDGGLQAYRPAMFYAGSLAFVSGILILTARFRINKSLLAIV
ncbi:MFS transporter asaE-like protein [Cladobotryum mycophilum]|uniref:MFS transporter asaE-like protein n=1 Tax=Cladobotryum mycophilum TaxID=491253 RepID=A0ABR0SD21_9HYPO